MTEIGNGKKVRSMFDRISPRYDLLNRILSGGNDQRWRKRAVGLLGDLTGKSALDLCCGSGDFLQILDKKFGSNTRLYGADFSANMLSVARSRLDVSGKTHLLLIRADAMELPFDDNSMAAVTIGFGIRNVADKMKSLREIHRVLTPGGRLAIIEPSIPKNKLMASLFAFYFGTVMPLIGGIISGDYRAYKYLNDSVEAFPRPEEFLKMMTGAGFGNAAALPQLFGTAIIYLGDKAA